MADCCSSGAQQVVAGSTEIVDTKREDAIFVDQYKCLTQEPGPSSDVALPKSACVRLVDLDADIDEIPEWKEILVAEPPKVPATIGNVDKAVLHEEEDNNVPNPNLDSTGGTPIAKPYPDADVEDQRKGPRLTATNLNYTMDTCTTSTLRKCGEFVGIHPCKVACCAFVFAIVSIIFGIFGHAKFMGGDGFVTKESFKYTWTESGGDLEDNLKMYDKYRKTDWNIDDYHIAMAYGKGSNYGNDITNAQAFAELQPLLKKWMEMNVTVGSLTFNTVDICKRGLRPDAKPGVPGIKLPCLIVTPLLCFREFTDALEPQYLQVVDKTLAVNPAYPPFASFDSFTARPRYNDSTPAEIKRELTELRSSGVHGCNTFMRSTTLEPTTFFGEISPKWNSLTSTNLSRANGVRQLFYYDPPGTIAFRLGQSKPSHAHVNEIKEAIDKHAKKWSEYVFEYGKTTSLLKFTNLRPGALEDAAEESRKLQPHLIILGLVLLYIYGIMVSVDFRRPMRSRTVLVTNGFCCILFSLVVSFSVFIIVGGRLNSSVLTGVPLLQLGLGADDMFVLMHYFNDLGEDFIEANPQHVILGELCLRSVLGVLLTSLCNFLAFFAGVFIPLKGLSDFCLGVAICALCNVFFMLTEFLPFMCVEIRRIKRNGPEWHPLVYFCHRRILMDSVKKSNSNTSAGVAARVTIRTEVRNRMHDFFANVWAPFLMWWPVKIIVTFLSFSFLAFTVVRMLHKDIGWSPGTVAPDGTEANKALPMLFDHFQMFPITLCFKPELDQVANQREMLELFKAVSSRKHTTRGLSRPYLTTFYSMLPPGSHTGTWNDSVLAPMGIGPTNATLFYQAYHRVADPPFHNYTLAATQLSYLAFDYADNQKFTFGPEPTRPFVFSWFGFQAFDLYTDQDMVDCLKDIHSVIDDSPLKGKVFIISSALNYWASFLQLEKRMYLLLGISLVAIGVVTATLLLSPKAAIIGLLVAGMIVFEVFGVCVFFLKFNPFIVATLLSAAGLSVEMVSHTIAAFFIEKSGTATERLGQAMKQTFLPVFHGTLSTALAVSPILFSPLEFIVLYQCYPMFVFCVIGSLNAFLVLPVMLGLMYRS